MSAEDNEAEYNLTASYGESIAIYRGEGMLTLQNEQSIPGGFEAGQLRRGSVLLICRFPQHFDLNIPAWAFEGRTIEGFRVSTVNYGCQVGTIPVQNPAWFSTKVTHKHAFVNGSPFV